MPRFSFSQQRINPLAIPQEKTMKRNYFLILLVFYTVTLSKCAIRIVSPTSSLIEKNGSLTHSMALFGRPTYGGQLTGTLYLAPQSNLNGCQPFNKSEMPSWTDENHNYILMVERGGCHFVEKVRNAQKASARGVVIYDKTNPLYLPVMADDGSGGDVHIPSVLILRKDGLELIRLLESNETVVVSLSWQVPHPDNRVEWEFWMSSRDWKSQGFIRDFKYVFQALKEHAQFTPRYAIFDGNKWGCTDMKDHCSKLCLDNGKYCAYDPESDPTIGLDGIDVLQEDIRQLCIWSVLERETLANATSKWWDYVIAFNEKCSVKDATNEQFNVNCSEKLQTMMGIDVQAIRECTKVNGSSLLAAEMEDKEKYGIISVPRVVVNNLQHYGDISCPHPIELGMCSPLRMICSGYLDGTQPEVCSNSFWGNQCYPPKELDDCGVCNMRNDSKWSFICKGCDGIPNSGKVNDKCGVCGGDGAFDPCGKCLQRKDSKWGKSCMDCKGVVNGDAVRDACGVCGGHGSFDACGLCLDQYDPKRQNYECKMEDDPAAVRVKLRHESISVKRFSGDFASLFKKALSSVCHVSVSSIVIKSVLDTGSGGCSIFAFIITKDNAERDQVGKLLGSPSSAMELSVRLRKNVPISSEFIIESVSSGDGLSSKNEVNGSTGSIILSVIVVLAVLVSIGFVIMRRREQRIRRDIHEMFAKYTPLVSMDDDDEIDNAQPFK